jgi:hypothetical protein
MRSDWERARNQPAPLPTLTARSNRFFLLSDSWVKIAGFPDDEKDRLFPTRILKKKPGRMLRRTTNPHGKLRSTEKLWTGF